jgi:peptidoglycan/xylan/chitin deacetylase (PgdA/CDA1 family)
MKAWRPFEGPAADPVVPCSPPVGRKVESVVSTDAKRKVQLALTYIPAWHLHPKPRVVVLSYHSIHPSARESGTTSPELFEAHLRWLRRHCDVVPLLKISQRVLNGSGRPTVAITFDDGFADNYLTALPILLRHEIPATFFLATGLVDRDPSVLSRSWSGWQESGSTLTWPQVLEMRRNGMEFGAHGHRHVPLALLTDEEAREDLHTSKAILEKRLEQQIDAVAFPFGRPRRHVSTRTLKIAKEVGFDRGYLVLYRRVLSRDSPLGIPRFVVNDDPVGMVRAKVLGALDMMGLYQERAPLWAVRIIAGKHFIA